jgi:hypothetical protein
MLGTPATSTSIGKTKTFAAAENSLRAAAATDAGDFFRFTLDPGQRITQERHTLRVPVIAYLGLREFARFHVDLVTDLIMTAPPEEVPPLVPVSIAGITSTTYRGSCSAG